MNATIGLIMTKLPDYVKSTPQEIQVLTPMKSGILGVENMNVELQKYINKPDKYKKEHEFGKYIFREGDKVMQIKTIIKLNGKLDCLMEPVSIQEKVYLMEIWEL